MAARFTAPCCWVMRRHPAWLESSFQAAREEPALAVSVLRIGPGLVFERLWDETGCRTVIGELAQERRHGFDLERVVFLTVLHRLMGGGSDRAADRWREDYRITGATGSCCTSSTAPWPGSAKRCRRPRRMAPHRLRRAASRI